MRKMAGDFDNTLTSLQKAQSEKQLLQQQLSSQQAELDRVREEVKEKERVWEEERVDVRRRAKEFAELEESVTQLREVSAKVVVGVACCYGYHAPPLRSWTSLAHILVKNRPSKTLLSSLRSAGLSLVNEW